MSKCTKSGCRNLEWKCADCGRTVTTAMVLGHPGYGEWIDREKQFPEIDKILCLQGKHIYPLELRETKWGHYYFPIDGEIEHDSCWTHWMPIPELPK